VFVHQPGVKGASLLRGRQEVEFDVEDVSKGTRAINVKVVE